MVFSAPSASHGLLSPAQRVDTRQLVEADLARVASLSPAEVRRHQDYYQRTLGHIEELRGPVYALPDHLFRPSSDDRAVASATAPRAGDSAEQAELRAEYDRVYRSIQRELTRANNQREALGPGQHTMAGGVKVEVADPEVVTLRPDGNWRRADLSLSTVRMGGPGNPSQRLRKEGTCLYRDDPSGWERFSLDVQGDVGHERIYPDFRLEIVAPGGGRESVKVRCRARGEGPGELFEVDYQGKALHGALEISLVSGLPSPKRALEQALRLHLGALLGVSSAAATSVPASSSTASQAPLATGLSAKTGLPRIRLELAPMNRAQPYPGQTEKPPAAREAQAPQAIWRPAGASKAAAQPDKGQPKPPPPLRLRLENGVRVTSTSSRLRKARKLAAQTTHRETGAGKSEKAAPRHTEQVALRLAAFSEEQLETFEQLGLTFILVPLKNYRSGDKPRLVEATTRPWKVAQEALFQPLLSGDEDPLLLELDRLFSDHQRKAGL